MPCIVHTHNTLCIIIATPEVTIISTTAMASSSASSVQATSDIVTTPAFTEMHNGEQYTVDISLIYHKATFFCSSFIHVNYASQEMG